MHFPEFERLYKTIEKLRDPVDGCPWDLEQTHGTLLKYLIEEAYEFLHAVESGESNKMEEGDYIVDFYCHELMLAIEIDGDSHLYKYAYDKNRQGRLELMGVTFIRFNDLDVKQNIFSVTLSLNQLVQEMVIKKDGKE